MNEFATEVVEGEGGSGSVLLDGLGAGADAGFVLAVWNDGDDAPSYTSTVEATDESLSECEKLLSAAGLDVIRDGREWAKMCRRWERLA